VHLRVASSSPWLGDAEGTDDGSDPDDEQSEHQQTPGEDGRPGRQVGEPLEQQRERRKQHDHGTD
jgi:hypothetical protein